ncbi:DUF3551 domain-containing protein [Pseudolabrys sp.]|uniref:DUF3551 domain-containing protein n=1 Tax=Pseudolabrys sp. TaxID=1960880 RepID=UPI003D1096D4
MSHFEMLQFNLRRAIPVLAVAAVLPLMAASPAAAQTYPWCSIYGGSSWSGAENCGFSTYRQCMENVSGVGGFCQRNPLYQPPAKRSKRSRNGER